MDTATSAAAGVLVLNPWWIDVANTLHPVGSIVLQILGAAWLIMQMYYKFKKGH